MDPEFYIGYLKQSPPGIARQIRRFVFLAGLVVLGLSWLLASQQRGFMASTFEYARETELRGRLITEPLPAIQVVFGKRETGVPVVQTIPLVQFGKHGGWGLIEHWQEQMGRELSGVIIRGNLIYYDGKALLEVADPERGLVSVYEEPSGNPPDLRHYGQISLTGEIVDAKCFFGVMKPGHGKPHRSCAIRCIAGGIPAVLRVQDSFDRTVYHLIELESGPVSGLSSQVGETVKINGELIGVNDWTVLKIRDPHAVKPLTRTVDMGISGAITMCY